MANVRPSYDDVKYSGVSSQEAPGEGAILAPYSESKYSGVSTSSQPDSPVMPDASVPGLAPYAELQN